jgi:hypothetical protein
MRCLVIASSLTALIMLSPLRGQAEAQAAVATTDPLRALAQLPAAPASDRSVKLSILDADKKPCPNAIVVLAPPEVPQGVRARGAEAPYLGDPIRMLAATVAEGATRLTLDDSGSTRIPAAFQGTILAFTETSFGIATRTKDASRTPQTMRLVALQWVNAKVTRHDGAPAPGVTIQVEDPRRLYAKAQVVTGPDGTARVPVLALEPDLLPSYSLRAMVACKTPIAHSLLMHPLQHPDDAIALVLPECSSLRVGWSGLPPGITPHIALQQPLPTNRLGLASSLVSVARLDRTMGIPQSCSADAAHFAYVEAGIPLEAAVTLDGVVGALLFSVPTLKPGQENTWSIDFASGPPRIEARILGSDGKPLANKDLVAVLQGGAIRGRYDVKTNLQGKVYIAPQLDSTPDTALRFAQYRDGLQSEIVAAGALPLAAVKPGANDLGDVQLQPDPIALAGRLLSPNAAPVVGVRISVLFQSTQYYSTPSSSDGTFTLRIPAPHPPTLRVSLLRDSNCYFADVPGQATIELPSNQTDAVIRLERSGRMLIGLTPPLPTGLRGISLKGVDLDHSDVTFQKDLPSDAKMIDVPAGRWKITLLHYQQPVATVDEVTVDPGVENHDARLMAIDWRAFATLATLRLEAPDGNPTSECSLIAYAQKPQLGAVAIPVAGKAMFLLPKAKNSITIRPADPSLRIVELTDVAGDQTVRFAHAIRFDLSWQEPLNLPANIEMVAMPMTSGTARRILTFDAAGKATLYAQESGKVDLHLGLRIDGKVSYLDDVMEVEVGEQGGPRVLRMPPTVRAAIDAARK